MKIKKVMIFLTYDIEYQKLWLKWFKLSIWPVTETIFKNFAGGLFFVRFSIGLNQTIHKTKSLQLISVAPLWEWSKIGKKWSKHNILVNFDHYFIFWPFFYQFWPPSETVYHIHLIQLGFLNNLVQTNRKSNEN